MMEASAALVIVALGVLGIIALTAIAFLRAQATQRTANKLVELALGGRADEARILARNASRDLAPLLEALGDKLDTPRHTSFFRDLVLVVPIAFPAVVLAIYGLTQVHGGVDGKVNGASSLLFGYAILVPVSFAAAYAILSIGRHSSRLVRGSYITLLVRSVKSSVEGEVAEAMRRTPRDPRGE